MYIKTNKMSNEVARLYTGMCDSKGIDICRVIDESYSLNIRMCDGLYSLLEKELHDRDLWYFYGGTLESIRHG